MSPDRTWPSYFFTLGYLPLLPFNYFPFPINRGHSGHLDEDPSRGRRSRCCCCPLPSFILADIDMIAEKFASYQMRTQRHARRSPTVVRRETFAIALPLLPTVVNCTSSADDMTARCPCPFWSTQRERPLCSKNSALTTVAVVHTTDPLLDGGTGPWDPPANLEALNLRTSSLPSRLIGTAMTAQHCLVVQR